MSLWYALTTYDDKFKGMGDKEITPDNLRAAAKVLEDKAKELEKPKLTGRQLEYVNYAKSVEDSDGYVCLASFKKSADGSCTYTRIDKDTGEKVKFTNEEKCTLLHQSFVNTDRCHLWFAIFKDEYGDHRTAMMYPDYP